MCDQCATETQLVETGSPRSWKAVRKQRVFSLCVISTKTKTTTTIWNEKKLPIFICVDNKFEIKSVFKQTTVGVRPAKAVHRAWIVSQAWEGVPINARSTAQRGNLPAPVLTSRKPCRRRCLPIRLRVEAAPLSPLNCSIVVWAWKPRHASATLSLTSARFAPQWLCNCARRQWIKLV